MMSGRPAVAGATAAADAGAAAERFILGFGPEAGPPAGRRLTPPVGFPLPLADLVDAAETDPARARRDFAAAFRASLGVRFALAMDSGRAALALALAALHRARPDRDEVVLPAFTCFTLPAAAVRAGLRVRLVDLVPQSFAPDPDQLSAVAGPRTLAVVAPHLVGYPLDLTPLRHAAARVGAIVVDDAAQALGARIAGLPAGAAGDLGILSFGRGKPLTALGGGAVICDDPQIAAPIEDAARALAAPPRGAALRHAAAAALYTPVLSPRLYWLPARLRFLKLGLTEYDPGFPLRPLDAFRTSLAVRGLERLALVNEARRRTAERLTRALADIPGLTLLPVPAAGHVIFLRFPILFPSPADRDRAHAALRAAGIGSSRLYPAPLTAIPHLARHSPDAGRSFPVAAQLAGTLLCVPTYPHVGEREVAITAAILRSVLATPETRGS